MYASTYVDIHLQLHSAYRICGIIGKSNALVEIFNWQF